MGPPAMEGEWKETRAEAAGSLVFSLVVWVYVHTTRRAMQWVVVSIHIYHVTICINT